MEISVRDPTEFRKLLSALIDELLDAREHFKLHRSLDEAIAGYGTEFNQSPSFWSLTMSAHMDAVLVRLCKAYDLYEGKPSLNLRNFLDTIKANLRFFDEPNFRDRMKANAFVDSLAAMPRIPNAAQLELDRRSVSINDPLVKKLTVVRHNFLAHRSRASALTPEVFGQQNLILFSEIKALIDNGLEIMNRYSGLFDASVHTSLFSDDYKRLLQAVREHLRTREEFMAKQLDAVRKTAEPPEDLP